jgi:hypothetical protein
MSKGNKGDDAAAAQKKPRSFLIKTPNAGFRGERVGVKFFDGQASTEDAVKAHACLEFGYEVLDAETGEPAWPKDGNDPADDDGVKKK